MQRFTAGSHGKYRENRPEWAVFFITLPYGSFVSIHRRGFHGGTCIHCPEGSCTRPEGRPCRHPELVRPSLEACGFDVARTASELFGIELKWGSGGRMPEYLTLVCGFFHDAESVVWNG